MQKFQSNDSREPGWFADPVPRRPPISIPSLNADYIEVLNRSETLQEILEVMRKRGHDEDAFADRWAELFAG